MKTLASSAAGGLFFVLVAVVGARTILPRLLQGEGPASMEASDAPKSGPGAKVAASLELGAPAIVVLKVLRLPDCKAPGEGGERWIFRDEPRPLGGCVARGQDLELTVDAEGKIVAFRLSAGVAEVRTPADEERHRRLYPRRR